MKALGRRLLWLVMLHFVDDYFGADREESIRVAKDCFARLVRACLGTTAISEKKLEDGNPLVVLGIEITLRSKGATFWPSPDKVDKWCEQLWLALVGGKLHPGEASKLSGKLQWASQAAFKQFGRAMIRPFIDHARNRSSALTADLALAARWWLEVLELDLRQEIVWRANAGKQVHLFSDARSTPPRVAAVLLMQVCRFS